MTNNSTCIKIFLRLCLTFYFHLPFCRNLGFGFSFPGLSEDSSFCKCSNEIYSNNNISIQIPSSMIMSDMKNALLHNHENKKQSCYVSSAIPTIQDIRYKHAVAEYTNQISCSNDIMRFIYLQRYVCSMAKSLSQYMYSL